MGNQRREGGSVTKVVTTETLMDRLWRRGFLSTTRNEHFRTGVGMSDEGGLAYAKSIEDRDIVACPGIDVITFFRLAGWEKSSAGNPDDMKIINKLECQWIMVSSTIVRGLCSPRPSPVPQAGRPVRPQRTSLCVVWYHRMRPVEQSRLGPVPPRQRPAIRLARCTDSFGHSC
jgi:hypothetical protein